MHKSQITMTVASNEALPSGYFLMKLCPAEGYKLPEDIRPGQFVEVLPPDNATLLRRPISINMVDYENNMLWLLIRAVGKGTKAICALQTDDILNLVLPLGNGFTTNGLSKEKGVVLVGGGVGVAPLLYQAQRLKTLGYRDITMVYGARNKRELVIAQLFKGICRLEITTDDGSDGIRGLVTDSRALKEISTEGTAIVQCCGPAPMMKAVAALCKRTGTECEVSLENMMACGLGACLCCVEKTVKGNVCVCTEGPVFNIKELTW